MRYGAFREQRTDWDSRPSRELRLAYLAEPRQTEQCGAGGAGGGAGRPPGGCREAAV